MRTDASLNPFLGLYGLYLVPLFSGFLGDAACRRYRRSGLLAALHSLRGNRPSYASGHGQNMAREAGVDPESGCGGPRLFNGLLDEFHQSFTPGRGTEAQDLLGDLAGALAGVTVAIIVLIAWHGIICPGKERYLSCMYRGALPKIGRDEGP